MSAVGTRTGTALAVALFACVPTVARAAEVAVLKSSEIAAWRPAMEAFRAAAAGHTITEYNLNGSGEDAAPMIGSLRGRATILVAMGPLAAAAAREGAPEIPLVYCMVQDPAGIGLDESNAVGVAFSVPVRNQLIAFRTVHPGARRIGVVFGGEAAGRQVDEAAKAASGLQMEVVGRRLASAAALPQAMRELLEGPRAVDAVWVVPDPIVLDDASRRFLMSAALEAGKPVYSSIGALVREGALVANSPDVASIGQGVGQLVNRIARGEKMDRMAPLLPRSEVTINKRIADKLRLSISPEAMRAAHKVF